MNMKSKKTEKNVKNEVVQSSDEKTLMSMKDSEKEQGSTDNVDIITDVDDAPSEESVPELEKVSISNLALTADSTSLAEITGIIEEDDGDLLGEPDLIDEVESYLNGDTTFDTDDKKLEAGQGLLRSFNKAHNRAFSGIKGTFAGYAVQQGRLLKKLKTLVKNTGGKWEPWAGSNLAYIKPRTRQSYMKLASVSGVDNHLHLGKERLLLLESATKGLGGDDPIGTFLKRHNLEVEPEAEVDLDAYKEAVDLALDFERLKAADVNIEIESLSKFKADGGKVTAGLAKVLKAVESAGGDPNRHLTDPPLDSSEDPVKKVKSFQKGAVSLVDTIDWLSDNTDYVKEVNFDMVRQLERKLDDLKRLIENSEPATPQQ